jgi:outer membrane protein
MKSLFKTIAIVLVLGMVIILSSSKVNDIYKVAAEVAEQQVASKLAYANSSAILSELPGVKAADAELKTLEEQLRAKGQKEIQAFQAKYQELARQERDGELSPKQIEQEAQKLDEEQKRIAQLEQDMTKQVQEKRAALLQPILDQVNTAIADIAKQEGYLFVFDVTGGLLYADESVDITDRVRSALSQ